MQCSPGIGSGAGNGAELGKDLQRAIRQRGVNVDVVDLLVDTDANGRHLDARQQARLALDVERLREDKRVRLADKVVCDPRARRDCEGSNGE
jgi:hypothetical protein